MNGDQRLAVDARDLATQDCREHLAQRHDGTSQFQQLAAKIEQVVLQALLGAFAVAEDVVLDHLQLVLQHIGGVEVAIDQFIEESGE